MDGGVGADLVRTKKSTLASQSAQPLADSAIRLNSVKAFLPFAVEGIIFGFTLC